jgi:hypothetical protein
MGLRQAKEDEMKIAAFPKCYLEQISFKRTMTVLRVKSQQKEVAPPKET